MNNIQFEVLRMLYENMPYDPEYYARVLFKSEDAIWVAYESLVNDGFIQESEITASGKEVVESHRIDNAVILAAGMSTRFVPLNFEIPKGLLSVKGEILIERQICQLREKEIEEIVVVVGHMQERFEYLEEKYGVILVEATDYATKNNHASLYAAREYLKNTIVTSSDLYFTENIFQKYAYDAYYCTLYISGKTAERGVITDEDDRILETMYGDRCHDIWVTLGYAYFSKRFSDNFLKILDEEFELPETAGKFWADIQDEHLDELYMYAKHIDSDIIYEFDSLEELREFDDKYLYDSGSDILHKICYLLAVKENNIVGIEALKKCKETVFRFRCKGDTYLCDVSPDERERFAIQGRVYYQCHDFDAESNITFKLYKMDKNIKIGGKSKVNTAQELEELFVLSKDFDDYHKRSVPLCAAENVISPFANLPLSYGFQERYIMNNTYSFNMDDNFIGCEKLFPFYQKLSEVCERIFGAKYTDPRPFTGMHCIDMITKTICKPGDKMMLLSKEHGGHASVKPVVERLGVVTYEAPYDMDEYDLVYEEVNEMIKQEGIQYILLAPSDLIKPLDVEQIDTTNCILLWDCSQLMGLIAAGLCPNPLKTKKNMIMFGGTHKTFPGPASGLIMTNDKYLHDLMEKSINPKFLRHSQMHQKISLLFALIEFEKHGSAYMSHMVHCSNYLGEKLKNYGFDIADWHGQISSTHQIFIRCSKDEMDTIYDNAYKCEVTLNKKHKDLFLGYGIRLGTQEIARYDWNDEALDKIALILVELSKKDIDINYVQGIIHSLPDKKLHYVFLDDQMERFKTLMTK
ncbi:MAG: NTP transferase domain-containing protein [Lachnospiraceae bacterium]|nr:NTP transferase domain-containing protein [Lachnospiraceae bacterium]